VGAFAPTGSTGVAVGAEKPISVFWESLVFEQFVHQIAPNSGRFPVCGSIIEDVIQLEELRLNHVTTAGTLALAAVGRDELCADPSPVVLGTGSALDRTVLQTAGGKPAGVAEV
jgi:hypothetical protein